MTDDPKDMMESLTVAKLAAILRERDNLRARCDVLEQECRERERAAEVSARLLTELQLKLSALTADEKKE